MLLLGAFAGSAHADAQRIALWPEQPAVGTPFRIELEGVWAKTCAPRVERAFVDGADIHLVVASQKKAACAGAQTESAKVLSASPGESELRAESAGVYRLYAHDATSGEMLAFSLARIGDDPLATTPESGLWWPEPGGEFANSGPGFGVQVEMQGDVLALTATGYRDSGQAAWWFGAGSLQSNLSTLSLSALTGGSAPFGVYAAPKEAEPAGNVHVSWLSAARAVFWFERVDPASGKRTVNPISMARFAFGMRPGRGWLGTWAVQWEGLDTERVRFDRIIETEGGFELSDARTGLALQCVWALDRPQSPPQTCQLSSDDGLEASLSDIGLRSLRGVSEAGGVRLQMLEP